VSLQGSLDTFALPDVLVLLASTSKTGELHIAGNRGPGGPRTGDLQGLLWLEKGKLVGFDVGKAEDAANAVFELLRLSEGSFSFMAGSAPKPQPPLDIEPVLTEAQAYLKEWQEIERVVPSLAAWVSLAPEAPGAHVSMRAEQWRLIVTIGGGCEVARIVAHLAQGELGGCRAVKELAEAGLVTVGAHTDEIVDVATPPSDEAAGVDSDLFRMVNGPATTVVDERSEPVFDTFTATSVHVVDDEPAEEPAASVQATSDAIIGDRSGETLADFENLVTLPTRARKPRLEPEVPAKPAESRRTLSSKLDKKAAAASTAAAEPAAPVTAVTADAPEKLEAQALARQLASLGDDPADPAVDGAEGQDGDEPLNRGLLLKFLSSVRN
jgi:uncharacterized protein DUF4388